MFKLAKIGIALFVVLAGLSAADILLRHKAETELTKIVERQAPGSTGVHARISSFPFVGRVLASGRVSQVEVKIAHTGSSVAGRTVVPLSGLDVVVHDVDLDTSQGIRARPRIKSIGRGDAHATITEADLKGALPSLVPAVALTPILQVAGLLSGRGELTVTQRGDLSLHLPGFPAFGIPLPIGSILPCPPQVAINNGIVSVTCTFTDVPQVLVDVLNGRR